MKNVLIIDDEKDIDLAFFTAYEREEFEVRRDNRKAIESGEYAVTLARNYEEGIEQLKKGNWDLLLLDGRLPNEKTGVNVLEFLINNREFLPKEIRLCTGDFQLEHKMTMMLENLY